VQGIGAILLGLALAAPAAVTEYVVGDVWTFKARPHQPTAKVAIAHIEPAEDEVLFVYLLDVKPNSRALLAELLPMVLLP
jgi:hypothetical protein